MDPTPPKRRGRPRKYVRSYPRCIYHLSFARINLVSQTEVQTNETKIECKIPRFVYWEIFVCLVSC